MKLLAGFLVFWVIMQGTFGYLTVSLKLWPQVVTTHLMSGFLTTVIIWLLYFKVKDLEDPGRIPWSFNPDITRLINISLVVVSIQIFLGAWTSTNYASISCADLPLCRGQLLPPADFISGFNFLQTIGPNYLGGQLSDEARVAIHLTHRFGSIVVTLVLLSLIFSLYKNQSLKVAVGLSGALALQISLGISNVIFSLPLLIAVGHNLGGLLLITYLAILRFRE
jgi:cytochrome c oxidase assembly protein subunit 15